MKNKLIKAGCVAFAMTATPAFAQDDEAIIDSTTDQEAQLSEEMESAQGQLNILGRFLKAELDILSSGAHDFYMDDIHSAIDSMVERPTADLLRDLKRAENTGTNGQLDILASHIATDLPEMLRQAHEMFSMMGNCLLLQEEWDSIRAVETPVTDIDCDERGRLDMVTVRVRDPDTENRFGGGAQFAHYDFHQNRAYFTEEISNDRWESRGVFSFERQGGLYFDQISDEKMAEIEALRETFSARISEARHLMREEIINNHDEGLTLHRVAREARQITISEDHRIPFEENPHFRP